MPYTGASVYEQIQTLNAWGQHPLLKKAVWGEITYSDIGYRLLAEILEMESGQGWKALGKNLTGLDCAPWNENLVLMPPGADLEAWQTATAVPFPDHLPNQPHDANARAGMKGHAGFAATPESAYKWIQTWCRKYPAKMAVETNHSQDGQIWGLGLQRLKNGEGSFAEILNSKVISGIHVLTYDGVDVPPPVPPHIPADLSDWWFHFGYTGPALFIRPSDRACVLILCHRLKNKSELLNIEELRARRWSILEANGFVNKG
jgi:CubicO group peptidase (beta-lactamase class C family)